MELCAHVTIIINPCLTPSEKSRRPLFFSLVRSQAHATHVRLEEGDTTTRQIGCRLNAAQEKKPLRHVCLEMNGGWFARVGVIGVLPAFLLRRRSHIRDITIMMMIFKMRGHYSSQEIAICDHDDEYK